MPFKRSSMDKRCTQVPGQQNITSKPLVEDKSKGTSTSETVKPDDKCMNDSRLSDSGFLSGSNIHSEEFVESPVSTSSEFTLSTDKISDKLPSSAVMRLDSGIDICVSQEFSELSLNAFDDDKLSYNNLNQTPRSKSPSNLNIQLRNNFYEKETTSEASEEVCLHQNEDGDTELHLAIIQKFIEAAFSSVRSVPHSDYLNIKNDDRQTPLHLAVLTSQPKLVRMLVCSGAALDPLDCYGNTALHLAVMADDLECARQIINPVTAEEIKMLHLRYTPRQLKSPKDVADIVNYEGQTCLHIAALNGNLQLLHHLVWCGANINAKEWKGGLTCLHIAVAHHNLEMCKFLLESGADPEEQTYAGRTAYQSARFDQVDYTVAATLRQNGADTCDEDSSSEDDSDDDMLDVPDQSFTNGLPINGNGMVNVGA